MGTSSRPPPRKERMAGWAILHVPVSKAWPMNGTAGNVFGIEVIEASAAVVGVDETIADAL